MTRFNVRTEAFLAGLSLAAYRERERLRRRRERRRPRVRSRTARSLEDPAFLKEARETLASLRDYERWKEGDK